MTNKIIEKFDPVRGMNFEELQERALMWAKSQDLLYEDDAYERFMEFVVSVFDFKSDMDCLGRIGQSREIYSGYEQRRTQENMELEMGRIIVKLVILCKQLDICPIEAMRLACSRLRRIKNNWVKIMKKFLVTISYEVDTNFANNKMVFEAFEDLLNKEKDEYERVEVISVISTEENRGWIWEI